MVETHCRPCAAAFPAGLQQPEGSMRFSADALLLPAFVARALRNRSHKRRHGQETGLFSGLAPHQWRAADLGCGCGASSLALLLLVDKLCVWGVDIAPELVASARANSEQLGLGSRTNFTCGDVRELGQACTPMCDIVQINPPYWEEGRGHVSEQALNETARRGSVEHFLKAAREILVHHGSLFLIFPAERTADLFVQLDHCRFGVRTVQYVRPLLLRPARRILVEAKQDARHDTVIVPDLILYEKDASGINVVTKAARDFCPWLH